MTKILISHKKEEGSTTPKNKFLNNAINTEGEDFGLFPTIAMINHSCCPNAGKYEKKKFGNYVISSVWGSTGMSSELEVRATESLKEGDEITVGMMVVVVKEMKMLMLVKLNVEIKHM